ncbi:hypothetical protein MXD62_04630 [Frankia sp. Mgl5]|uniref:hypothetical protein n=1 Tax=Frankia sp. Mgl5 TaxID=2933793 RepID=UPI00200F17CE|nr:hypothetical protein [Frankia sp. Mgl5]MCK9926461.1 hypothetical protein [Frankia sp. Mgl5]
MSVCRPPRPRIDGHRVLVDQNAYLLAATGAVAKVDPNRLDDAGLLAYAQVCATISLVGVTDDLPDQVAHAIR